jgi:hypothetical protein
MLEGPARIWLNNLPAGSINGWMDFEEQFVSNFTSTYKRPNRPQQLANCRQGDYEIDRDYLTRWCTLRNSFEGVVEQQAIMWFAQGCRHGTMLWQKLQRDMPATLAETIKIADSYALGDPLQPTLASQGQGQSQRNNNAGGSGQFYRPDNRNKRRDDRPDYRYGSSQVAAVEEEQGGAGSNQRPRYEGYQQQQPQQQAQPFQKKNVWVNKNAGVGAGQKKLWPKYTVGLAMDKPCVFHKIQPGKPANHLTRNCSWLDEILAGRAGPFGPARPPVPAAPSPLIGANTIAVPPRPGNPGNQSNAGNADVNQVDQSYNPEFYTAALQRARMSTKSTIRATWSLRPKEQTSRVCTGGVWK